MKFAESKILLLRHDVVHYTSSESSKYQTIVSLSQDYNKGIFFYHLSFEILCFLAVKGNNNFLCLFLIVIADPGIISQDPYSLIGVGDF